MKYLNRAFLLTLFILSDIYFAAANGNNNLGQVVRLSKQGLNYATATIRLGQRFFPAGSPQPATLTISGIPKGVKIEAAYFWISTSGNGDPIALTFRNPGALTAIYPMSLIGSGADKCWDFPASLSYRADVTASIKDPRAAKPADADYNGNYTVSGLPTKAPEPDPPPPTPPNFKKGNDVDGGTLMIIYTDPNANYIGNIIINDGSVVRAPGTAAQNISEVNPINPLGDAIPSTGTPINARAFMGAGDFQFASDAVVMNNDPAFLTIDWNWWNFYDRPTTITKGQTNSSFAVSSSTDCWNWTLMGIYYQTFELELIGLEVNQTIQDLENNIPLIEKKTTRVRAFVQSNDATIKNIQPKLKVKRGTDSVYLTAKNVNIFKAQPQTTGEAAFIDKRKDNPIGTNKYLFFELPPDWCTGTIELSFEKGIDCKVPNSTFNNNCKTTMTFNPSKVMDLVFYKSEWTNENGVKQTFTDPQFKTLVGNLEKELIAYYPISKINKSYQKNNLGVYNFAGATPANAPFRRLFIRNNDRLEAEHFNNHPPEVINNYVGIVRGFSTANNPQGRALTNVATFHDKALFGTVPHEIGHLLGRGHVNSTACPTGDHDASFPADNFYMGKATLGPMSQGVGKMIFGYSSQLGSIINPQEYGELMTYCDEVWTSNHTYNALRSAINSRYSTNARLATNQAMAVVPGSDYRLVRGLIDVDNNSVEFDPIIPTASTLSPAPGNYQLQFLDGTNNIVKTISFEPTPHIKENLTEPNLASFIIPVQWETSIKKVVLLKNNIVLGQIIGSANIPTVHVLFPNGGENLTGSSATFTWDGNDADGDPLTYGVQFSKDGGNTWETLDIDISDKSYEAELSFLGATTNGLIRVFVSDRFNVAMDESDGPFQTPNSAPEAYISHPANGDVFVGEQPISFSAVARDLEDGDLPDSALSWYSSIDGFLGHRASIYKPAANELSEGEHTIYFKATDSFGDTITDSIKITIQRIVSSGPVYYSKPSGNLHDLLTWGENPDGSGANPPDFGSGKTFQLSNRPGLYTMTGDWVVGGIISIPTGSQLQISSNTLSITNRIGTGTISGSPTSNLVVLTSGDAFTLNLTAGNSSLNNLTINSGANTVLSSVLDLYGILTVDGTFNTGATPPVLLTFKSTATNTARLAPVTGTILQGSVGTEQYIPARRAWRMMNSPLNGAVSIFNSWQESRTNVSSDPNPFPGYGTHITGGPVFGSVANGFDQNPGAATSLKSYNSAIDTWIPVEQTISWSPHLPSMIFIRGDRGISLSSASVPPTPTVLRHTGQLEVGNVNSFVFATGFTPVRNPYQSPVNFATLTRDNVQNNFYLWDPKMGGSNGVGAYVLVSYNGSTYDVIPASVSAESQYIQTGQSFMVRTVNTGLPGSIIFKESDKSATPTMDVFRTSNNSVVKTSNAPTFSDPGKGQGLRINLQVVNNDGTIGIADEVFSSYKSSYSDLVDELDGLKMENVEANLGIVRNGQILMLERKLLPSETDTIPLKLWNTLPKKYIFEFTPVNLSNTGLSAFIEDKYLKTFTPVNLNKVSQIQFNINSSAASARTDRFSIVFSKNSKPADLITKSIIMAYPNPVTGRSISLQFTDQPAGNYVVTIVNSFGRVMLERSIQHIGGLSIKTLQLDKKLPTGVYKLQVTGKNIEATTQILSQ